MLPVALRTVGLHVTARFAGQPAESAQEIIGARGNEPRGDHRMDQPRAAGQRSDVGDELACLALGHLRRRVAIILGALLWIVHRHASDQGALWMAQADIGKHLGRRQVNAREVHRRSRAIGQQAGHQRLVDPLGVGGIGIPRLQRKRELLQPFLERQVQRLAQLWPLRRMHVQIDHSRQHILLRSECDQCPHRGQARRLRDDQRRVVWMYCRDGAMGRDDDEGIVHELQLAALRRMQEGSQEGPFSLRGGWLQVSGPVGRAGRVTAAYSAAGSGGCGRWPPARGWSPHTAARS